MKRILLMVFRNVLLVPFMWVKLCYMASHPDKFTEKQHFEMLRFITERANKGGNVIIDAHGIENIPEVKQMDYKEEDNFFRKHFDELDEKCKEYLSNKLSTNITISINKIETADDWTKWGDPWSIRCENDTVTVDFKDMSVKAVPYDMPVIGVGITPFMGLPWAKLHGGNEKIYFPWSIAYSCAEYIMYTSECKCVVSASVSTIIDTREDIIFVVPNFLYESYSEIDLTQKENIIPANIAYSFNYDASPNQGYFFVDLLEESGKLTKPPYDPKRIGYEFRGWYKDPECETEWDFENDIVEIKYDGEGNRVYEEIFLYAKWSGFYN